MSIASIIRTRIIRLFALFALLYFVTFVVSRTYRCLLLICISENFLFSCIERFQTVLGILVPPTIAFKEFKNKKELCQMPVTFEEYKQEQAKKDQDDEEIEPQGKPERSVAHFSKGDSQVHLR